MINGPINPAWRPIPISDEDWEDSYGPAMGDIFQKARCPDCEALVTKDGICLNACHLSVGSYRRFQGSLQDSKYRNEGESTP